MAPTSCFVWGHLGRRLLLVNAGGTTRKVHLHQVKFKSNRSDTDSGEDNFWIFDGSVSAQDRACEERPQTGREEAVTASAVNSPRRSFRRRKPPDRLQLSFGRRGKLQ